MIVIICGVPNEVNSFSVEVENDNISNWTRFKITLANNIKNIVNYEVLMRHYFPLFLMNDQGVIGNANDLLRSDHCVLLPRGSIIDHANTEITNSKDNDRVLNWSQCYNSFLAFDEYTDEMREALCNLNFKQIGFGVVKCQTCSVAQKFENCFLPIMTQHAIASPNCSNLDIWNGKLIIPPSVISTWAQKLTLNTIRTYETSSFTRSVRSRARVPEVDSEIKNIETPKCNICYSNAAQILYLPCLHYNTCVSCHKLKQSKECQTCHMNIEIVSKIFY